MNTVSALLMLPLLAASLLALARPSAAASRWSTIAVALVLLVLAALLVRACQLGHVPAVQVGGWPAPFGISLAVDRLGALFVLLQSVLLLMVGIALQPRRHGEDTVQRACPLLMVATAGLLGAFMTGDWFNLFVMFELVLVSTYLLLQIPGSRQSLQALMPLVVINMVAAALFVAALGVLYGATGTLNMAQLTTVIDAADPGLRLAALSLLLAAFVTKAAAVPLCFWMPANYPLVNAPIAALMAGIMTKLGLYALLRLSPLLAQEPVLFTVLAWLGGASALLGVLAALAQYQLRRLLSFHSVSQLGYMLLALGLATRAGTAAAIFFALHHSLVKPTLYLVADELERNNHSTDLRAMRREHCGGWPVALVFSIAAFALAGTPPLSGFLGKLAVFKASYASAAWVGLGLQIVASVCTLISMLKIWRFAFQRQPGGGESHRAVQRWPAAALLMAVLIVLFSFSAGPLYRYGLATATQLHGVAAGTTLPATMAVQVALVPGNAVVENTVSDNAVPDNLEPAVVDSTAMGHRTTGGQ